MVVQAIREAQGQEARVPSFTSSRFINTDIGGISVARYTASRPMQALAKSLLTASQGNQVAFGGYAMLPNTLRNTIDSVHRNPFIFDAMLSIVHDGTSTYWRDTRPANRSVREIQRGDAYKTLLEGLQIPKTIGRGGRETEASKATRARAQEELRSVVESMLHDPTTKVYAVKWSNGDDTTITGVVALNERTGKLNVAKVFPAI